MCDRPAQPTTQPADAERVVCPKGKGCALNDGAVLCLHCGRRWPPDETWFVSVGAQPVMGAAQAIETLREAHDALAEQRCNGCQAPKSRWGVYCPGMTVGDATHFHSAAWWVVEALLARAEAAEAERDELLAATSLYDEMARHYGDEPEDWWPQLYKARRAALARSETPQ